MTSAGVVYLQHVVANCRVGLVWADVVRNMFWSCWRSETYEGAMDELVDQVVGNVGIARPVAERAVGIILDFLASEGPADAVQAVLERLPGSAEAAASAHEEGGGGGLFGAAGGLMGVGSRLMSAGLNMSEIQGVTRVLISYARDKAGDQDVNAIVDSIPGLSQFI